MAQSERLQLPEELRKARQDLGLTQEQWAQRLGVSVRTVSRWELGESAPRNKMQKEAIIGSVGEVNERRAGTLGRMLSVTSTVAGVAAGAFGPNVGMVGGAVGVGLGSVVGMLGGILLQAKMRGQTLDDVIAALGLSDEPKDDEKKCSGNR